MSKRDYLFLSNEIREFSVIMYYFFFFLQPHVPACVLTRKQEEYLLVLTMVQSQCNPMYVRSKPLYSKLDVYNYVKNFRLIAMIQEFILSEDYNKMTAVKSYQAHQSKVLMVLFVLEMEWLLSIGQDKYFTWHCSESGQRLGSYRISAGACGLQFDVETRNVFIGDHSGQVTILKLEQENSSLITTFRGHTGGISALCWDPVQRVLFSGSSDHSIIMWDIGGRKGTAIELQGHSDKVQSLSYSHHTRQLISCGADGRIVVWNMDVERQETPEWLESDSCQKCDQPFFWNFKQMWDSKKIGLRQHHCRKCGKAVCGKCSSKRSSIPLMGFEFEVRICDACYETITDEERAPTATFHYSKHNVVHVHFDATRGWLLTSGTDKVMKLWDMTPVVS
ncbi:hypothetical protein Chor_015493 [Crotalus horridus]